MVIALAFDIERSGSTNKYDTIAIGSSVVDETGKQLDSFSWFGYISGETKFEQRCWDEFWVNHQEILKSLEYNGSLQKEANESLGITTFQKFRAKWEQKCREDETEFILVSDNTIFDGGFINDLIGKYMSGTLPIPYSAGTQKYSKIINVGDIARGMIYAFDPKFALKNEWGFMEQLKKIHSSYKLANRKENIEHDHNPANDAYNIACDYQFTQLIIRANTNVKDINEFIVNTYV